MPDIVLTQLEYFARILMALFCGILLGYERENHLKAAGMRTHAVVAMASALMMLISKYGFFDIIAHSNVTLDPSRIAAGVVTAIGFLGAGVIFVRKVNVTGLTTAAGIWATVGIGMAVGAGMYIISIASTILLILFQYLFHSRTRLNKSSLVEQITIQMSPEEDIHTILDDFSLHRNIAVNSIRADRLDDQTLELKLLVRFPENYQVEDVVNLMKENPKIKAVDSR